MPLRRNNSLEPLLDADVHSVRFPLTNDEAGEIVWGEVSHMALLARASRDGLTDGLQKAALFERYRDALEGLASELFDDGRFSAAPDGTTVVRILNGLL